LQSQINRIYFNHRQTEDRQMVNHFKTEAAAKAHLVSNGFTQLFKSTDVWISADSYIEARIEIDLYRGPYIYYRNA